MCRGYNVAAPWVDVGDDMYVVEDAHSNFIRVQVKATRCKKQKQTDALQGRVNLPLSQLRESKKTKLIYVFAFRYLRKWQRVLVISKDTLEKEAESHLLVAKNKERKELNRITFWFRFFPNDERITCFGKDFTKYHTWDLEFPLVCAQSQEDSII